METVIQSPESVTASLDGAVDVATKVTNAIVLRSDLETVMRMANNT